MKVIYIICCLFCLLPKSVCSQASKISIWMEESMPNNPDSVRIKALSELGVQYVHINLDSSLFFADKLDSLAEEIDDIKGHAMALNVRSAILLYKRKLAESYNLNQKAIAIALELNDNDLLSRIYNTDGMIAFSSNDIELTIEQLLKALKYSELGTEIAKIPIIHGNLGYAHLKNDNVNQAEFHFKQMKVYADTIQNMRVKGFAIRNIGMLNAKKGETDKAEKNYLEAINLSKQTNDLYNAGHTRLMLGKLKFNQKKYDAAEQEFQQALQLFNQVGNVEHKIEIYVEILKFYNELEEYDKTIASANVALDFIKENKSTEMKQQFFEELAEAI